MIVKRFERFGLKLKTILLMIGLSILALMTEMFGISIFLPIFQYIRLDGDISALIAESTIWKYIVNAFSYMELEVSLTALLLISFSGFLSRQIFLYIRAVYNNTVLFNLIRDLRKKMFAKYLDANSSFHDEMPVGNLVNAMTTESNRAVLGLMAPVELLVHIIIVTGYLFLLAAIFQMVFYHAS